jgi:Tfp pilus assembly protein PilF
MNVRLYPESWNVYDSLGEAQAKAGDTALAIQNYEKSLQLNPQNEPGKAALAKLRGK